MQDLKTDDQMRSKANVNYWKMQDQNDSYLPIDAVVRHGGCNPSCCIVVAASDTIQYFITTTQNHLQRL